MISIEEVLDDISSRFILNLPPEDFSSFERLEEAYWFYDDFYREKYAELPPLKLKSFALKLFMHCPLLHSLVNNFEERMNDFITYKLQVPVCGAIILNKAMTHCILVKGYGSGSKWGFPRGKIGKDEEQADCAVREVDEEIGFDISDLIDKSQFIEKLVKKVPYRFYIIKDVSEKTVFETKTRKEISKIEWHPIAKLNVQDSKSLWLVKNFLPDLMKWIKGRKKDSKTTLSEAAGVESVETFSEPKKLFALKTTSFEFRFNVSSILSCFDVQ